MMYLYKVCLCFIHLSDMGKAPLEGYLSTIEKQPTKKLPEKCKRCIRDMCFTRSDYFDKNDVRDDRLYYYVNIKNPQKHLGWPQYKALYDRMMPVIKERKIDKLL